MVSIENMLKRIDTHITGIKEATNRSRSVFLFLNLTSLVVFVALFNETVSWQRHMNICERPLRSYYKEVGLDSVDTSFQELRKHYAEIYFEKQFFNIPLLGIKCTTSDLTVFAPLAMLIFTTWFFFALRRENHIVKGISIDFNKIAFKISSLLGKPSDGAVSSNVDEWKVLLKTLYSGCVQNFVLSTPTSKDYIGNNDDDKANFVARPIIDFLYWSPILILGAILFDDFIEYFTKNYLKNHGWEVITLDLILILLGGLIAYQIIVTSKIRDNTRKILSEMSEEINKKIYEYDI